MRNLLLLMVLLGASSAYADHPKYARKRAVEITVTPSERVRPIKPATTAQPQPALTGDDLMAIQELTDPIRQEQEGMLVQLIRDTPDSDPEKPDYLFRLAEHYAMQLRFWRLRAVGLSIGR